MTEKPEPPKSQDEPKVQAKASGFNVASNTSASWQTTARAAMYDASNFMGLYLATLFSLDAYGSAETSNYSVNNRHRGFMPSTRAPSYQPTTRQSGGNVHSWRSPEVVTRHSTCGSGNCR